MASHSADLLRHLEPPVRPVANGSVSAPFVDGNVVAQNRNGFEGIMTPGVPFANLIEMALEGNLETGRPIRVSPTIELTKTQSSKLAAAADRAEASGSSSAFVLMDGRAFLMNIAERSVHKEISFGQDDTGIHEPKSHSANAMGVNKESIGPIGLLNSRWNVDESGAQRASAKATTKGVMPASPDSVVDPLGQLLAQSKDGNDTILTDIDTAIIIKGDPLGSHRSSSQLAKGAQSLVNHLESGLSSVSVQHIRAQMSGSMTTASVDDMKAV